MKPMKRLLPGLAATAVLALASALPLRAADVATGTGAVLRALDKLNGTVEDIELPAGGAARFGKLRIELRECRYPEGNPAGAMMSGYCAAPPDSPVGSAAGG